MWMPNCTAGLGQQLLLMDGPRQREGITTGHPDVFSQPTCGCTNVSHSLKQKKKQHSRNIHPSIFYCHSLQPRTAVRGGAHPGQQLSFITQWELLNVSGFVFKPLFAQTIHLFIQLNIHPTVFHCNMEISYVTELSGWVKWKKEKKKQRRGVAKI